MSQKAPFEVPGDYFDKLPAIIQSRIGIEEEEVKSVVFEELKISKQHPFTVPDGYFRDLTVEIREKTTESKTETGWALSFGKQQLQWSLVPAMIILLVVGYFTFQNEQLTTDELISQVSSEDLVAYLEASDLTTEEIINSVDMSELDYILGDEGSDILDEIDFQNEDLEDVMLEFDIETDV